MSKEAELWARFDVSEDPNYPERLGNHFHLLPLGVRTDNFGEIQVACAPRNGVDVEQLQEASRTIEQRKKCPRCYEYWIEHRIDNLTMDSAQKSTEPERVE